MKKLTFDFNTPQIEVNGHIFELNVSDMDVIETALKTAAEFESLRPDNPDEIIAAVRKCEKYIDTMLGEGALKKISDGKPVSLVMAMTVMVTIAKEVGFAYNEKVEDEYSLFS